jgi:hypothetical protein
MIIAARQRQRPNLARSGMKFSSALSNPEALYHQTNFLECMWGNSLLVSSSDFGIRRFKRFF